MFLLLSSRQLIIPETASFFCIINTTVHYDRFDPAYQFAFVLVLFQMTEHPEHGIIEDDPGTIHIPCITKADLDHVRVAVPVQLFLALAILSQAAFDQYSGGVCQSGCFM